MEFILIAILKNIDNKIGRAWAKSHLMITHKTGKSNYVSQKTLIERDISNMHLQLHILSNTLGLKNMDAMLQSKICRVCPDKHYRGAQEICE